MRRGPRVRLQPVIIRSLRCAPVLQMCHSRVQPSNYWDSPSKVGPACSLIGELALLIQSTRELQRPPGRWQCGGAGMHTCCLWASYTPVFIPPCTWGTKIWLGCAYILYTFPMGFPGILGSPSAKWSENGCRCAQEAPQFQFTRWFAPPMPKQPLSPRRMC